MGVGWLDGTAIWATRFVTAPTYHFLIGGQFVAHPPGWPDNLVPSDDFVDYDVTITRPDDPIVKDIRSFRLYSEQYYLLTDPSNEVLATTTFSGDHLWWIEGTVIPVVWKRRWDKGRVFLLLNRPPFRRPQSPASHRNNPPRCALGRERRTKLGAE